MEKPLLKAVDRCADALVMEYEFDHIDDPYRRCEDHCNHDLVRGILVSDLLGTDGPYRPTSLLVTLPFDRGQPDELRRAS